MVIKKIRNKKAEERCVNILEYLDNFISDASADNGAVIPISFFSLAAEYFFWTRFLEERKHDISNITNGYNFQTTPSISPKNLHSFVFNSNLSEAKFPQCSAPAKR